MSRFGSACALLLVAVVLQLQLANAAWTLFAVTNSSHCGKSLPTGYDKINIGTWNGGSGSAPSAYVSTAHRELKHKYFKQKFYVDGELKFETLWTFPEYKTLQKRFQRAKNYGEFVEYEIIDYTATDNIPVRHTGVDSTKWFFSKQASDPMGSAFVSDQTLFSKMGGTWGLGSGVIDSSTTSSCGASSTTWWGHENCKAAKDEGACDKYQHSNNHNPNADPKRSDNIVSLMYAGSPSYNYARTSTGFTWPGGTIDGTRMSGCAVLGKYKTSSAIAEYGTFTVLTTAPSGSTNEDYELTFVNPSSSLTAFDATKSRDDYNTDDMYDIYLTIPETWPNLDSSASFTFAHPASLYENKAASRLVSSSPAKTFWGLDFSRQRSDDVGASTGTHTLKLTEVQPFVDRTKAGGLGSFKLLLQDVDHPVLTGDTGTFRIVITKSGMPGSPVEVFNGPMHVWLGSNSASPFTDVKSTSLSSSKAWNKMFMQVAPDRDKVMESNMNWLVDSSATLLSKDTTELYSIMSDLKYSDYQGFSASGGPAALMDFVVTWTGAWPSLDTTKNFNHWRQVGNPRVADEDVSNYVALVESFAGTGWGGLEFSSNDGKTGSGISSYIDGSLVADTPDDDGFYSIGQRMPYGCGIQGPFTSSTGAKSVTLWSRRAHIRLGPVDTAAPLTSIAGAGENLARVEFRVVVKSGVAAADLNEIAISLPSAFSDACTIANPCKGEYGQSSVSEDSSVVRNADGVAVIDIATAFDFTTSRLIKFALTSVKLPSASGLSSFTLKINDNGVPGTVVDEVADDLDVYVPGTTKITAVWVSDRGVDATGVHYIFTVKSSAALPTSNIASLSGPRILIEYPADYTTAMVP